MFMMILLSFILETYNLGKTYYGIDAPAASLIKLDDEVKKELPEETIIETAAVLAEENIIYEEIQYTIHINFYIFNFFNRSLKKLLV